ncbi:enoyl-CoA hydratase/isomerase family protein [Actinophytocola sp.]|jgi:2-(1,2-epoxy-1,2-dihydrophenyl)acetyl-CoA isomerase|uniref:enoyl-CoA hydratase/isomerase family protein n=1 Tax=Actinophytocola sp. TaxID=1872138 RepID=UPI002EDB65C0
MAELTVTDAGAVRTLAIDRPDRLNAMTDTAARAIELALRDAAADETVGAVVLTGVGEHFSAGGDAHTILDTIASTDDRALLDLMRSFHRLIEEVWNSALPVVAAVSGVAYGGGFNLALVCDLVVCAPDARFCEVFLRRGLVPDVGGAWLLPRAVGLHRAKELMLLTPELSAADAHRWGIVNAVADDPLAHATELATRLAAGPRLATSLTKKLVNASTTGDLHSSLELEAVTQALALTGKDARAGFEKFLRKSE